MGINDKSSQISGEVGSARNTSLERGENLRRPQWLRLRSRRFTCSLNADGDGDDERHDRCRCGGDDDAGGCTVARMAQSTKIRCHLANVLCKARRGHRESPNFSGVPTSSWNEELFLGLTTGDAVNTTKGQTSKASTR